MTLKWLVPVAGIMLATAATAQIRTPAPPRIQGEIAAGDETDSQGRRYDEYAVELVRGQRITITAAPTASSRFTPGVELYPLIGTTPLAARTAEGDSRTARLAFTATYDGVFLIRVVSGGPAAGRYTLSMQPNTASRSRAPTMGAIGAPAPSSPRPDTSGPRSRFIVCPGHPRCPR